MSKTDYSKIKTTRLQDIPSLPVHAAIAYLETLPEGIGEAIAKCCCQQIARSAAC